MRTEKQEGFYLVVNMGSNHVIGSHALYGNAVAQAMNMAASSGGTTYVVAKTEEAYVVDNLRKIEYYDPLPF